MKFSPLRLVSFLALCGMHVSTHRSLAQVTVESPAVGFSILELNPADGQNAQVSFAAPAYLNAVLHQGITTLIAGSSELTDPTTNWTVNQFNGNNGPHYIEILEVDGVKTAPAVGVRRDISGTQVNKAMLTEPWPSGLAGPVKYRIVKHWTIREVFGGLKASGTANSISGLQLIDSAAIWETNDFNGSNGPHYVEITSVAASTTAPEVGMRREIVATLSQPRALQVDEAWPETLVAPVSYRVVKHMAVRPNGTGNLQGGSATTADSFQLWENDTYQTYYYQTEGIGGIGWRRSGDQFTDRSDTPILPGQGIILSRGETSVLDLFLRGTAKTGITPLVVRPGYNFLANPYASTMTLASCGLFQGDPTLGVISGNVVTADQVLIWNGTSYDSYYYQSGGIGGTGWRQAGNQTADARNTIIPAASCIILRRMGATGFEWRVPAHPVQ